MGKIIFRADGNSANGLGHLYRVFALIEMFKDKFECVLLTKENSALNVIPEQYNRKIIPAPVSIEQEPRWISENYPAAEYCLIADGYHFNSAYQHQIKKLNYTLVYVDDLTTEYMYADMVINHSPSVKPSDYKAEPYTRFLLGPQYAILRPGFLEAAKNKRAIHKIDAAFVCFGGADPLNLTLKATIALLNIKQIKQINVVLGGAYLHGEIFELEKTHAHVNLFQNIAETEVLKVMQSCNFGIAPASTILYELCAVKMPLLAGYYVENQKNIYKGCVENSLVFEGGNFEGYSAGDFEAQIKKVLAEPGYEKYIGAQEKLFDSRIKERFLNLLTGSIRYRKANSGDLLLVFNWANDGLSRANSYFSEPIALETHKSWFEKKLKDENCSIYIAEVDGQPAGMIRYEVTGENAVVGVLVGEGFRGKGLAAAFLAESAKLYFKEHPQAVLAYIKQENEASVKSFEKANYKKIKEEMIHGHNSYVYKLENHHV